MGSFDIPRFPLAMDTHGKKGLYVEISQEIHNHKVDYNDGCK
jgi:hypothetical protein